eukprot:TRINITY_DN19438_c0_g1_i1.p1 TRINITY_DN19438_c0_g1~~TRINITY_DN19438_c0_g1_i1.p1  ORF type:complete len:208 (-),score=46.80 TRINITY_DN19438_c0_g1_i1:87-710(-)
MAPAVLFQKTARFQQALNLINGVEVSKFGALLKRVMGKLHLKAERIFSVEEEEQLRDMLDLSEDDLHTILDSSSYIIEQAAYHGVKAETLKQQLRDAGADDGHATLLGNAWEAQGPELLTRLRARPFGGVKTLQSVDWSLQLTTSQDTLGEQIKPTSIMQLSFGDVLGANEEERLAAQTAQIEFSYDQLQDFFNRLETLAEQVDQLS